MKSYPSAGRVLVVATTSRNKLEELISLLGLSRPGDVRPLEVRAIRDVIAEPPHVDEDGATFEENAMKKANAAASATRMLALADDSGLEVDALDGRPGVRSARFAGDGATDAENNVALLEALDALRHGGPRDLGPYRARYRCALALVDPLSGSPGRWSCCGRSLRACGRWSSYGRSLRACGRWTVEGSCEGTITRTPRGRGGFGYDPLFIPEGRDKTFAELDRAEKNLISHRARAVAALYPILRSLPE